MKELGILRRIYAKINQWFDEQEEIMKQWREEDPEGYYAAMEEQRRLWNGGFF